MLAPQEEVTAIQRMYHVTTFVPPELLDSLLDGVLREVPLTYGRYDRSAWWSAVGIEQFRPLPGSTPAVGRAGQVERVPTVRLEFVIPHDPDLLERVLNRGLIANHPWEEPAVLVSTTHTTANLDKLGTSVLVPIEDDRAPSIHTRSLYFEREEPEHDRKSR